MDKGSKRDRWIEEEVLPTIPGRRMISGVFKTLFFCAAVGAVLGLIISFRAMRSPWDPKKAIGFAGGGAALACIGWLLLNLADLWRARRWAAGKPNMKRSGPFQVVVVALAIVIGIVAIRLLFILL